MPVPTLVDGCLALRCPGAAHRGLAHEASFINEDECVALTLGFFCAWATWLCATWHWRPHRVHGHAGRVSGGSSPGAARDATLLRGNR
jgi:hypothetical protein